MTTLFFIYRNDPGPVLWSCTGLTAPDVSFDSTLRVLQPPSGTPNTPGAFSVQNGAVAVRQPTFLENRFAKAGSAVAYYSSLIAAGFTHGGVLFQIDADSQDQISAMGALALGSITDPAGRPWASGFYWIAADNSHVPMDAPATYGFARAVATYVGGCILRLRAVKDAIAAVADQPGLDAIDVTVGYPPAA